MKTTFGYVYTPDADPGFLSGAAPGAVVRKSDAAPPWIVVDHSIDTAIVVRWPGRLWWVEVLDTTGVPQASDTANYTRSVAVRVLEELPASSLFGEHGEAVVEVLSFASRLDAVTAERLAGLRHPDAGQAYSRAWRRWLDGTGNETYHVGADFSDTLAAGRGPKRSPINCGFTLIHRVVWERAEVVAGVSAFLEDDEGERSLGPVWGGAASALLDAAMAVGAPAVVGEEDAGGSRLRGRARGTAERPRVQCGRGELSAGVHPSTGHCADPLRGAR